MSLTSAAGLLALLDEHEQDLKVFALKNLHHIVDVFWAEISESVGKIEVLYEDEAFKQRQLSALLASKVYYHLGAYEDSLSYALGAGDLFDVNGHSEYAETIIAKCIDSYTEKSVLKAENPDEDVTIDPRLEAIVDRMFKRCFDDGKYKQAVGIALETRRLDVFEQAILKSDDVPGMLSYSLSVCMSLIQSRQFRNKVLRVLVQLYLNLGTPDFISVCQCFIFLDDPQGVADILEKLIKDNEASRVRFCLIKVRFLLFAVIFPSFNKIRGDGHEQDALKLMSTYLPKDGSGGSAYQEGGGLFALGLIHANHGGKIIDYLMQQLKNATTDMVRHGGCLGLGLAAMGSARQDVYEQLKTHLWEDDAVTGLFFIHCVYAFVLDQIVRIAQVMYARMEEADALIESLMQDKDHNLRQSGMYTVAMAYCGTGNNKAIKRLLHVAVSDVSDDVRRAAVMSLGFLLFRTPEQCPSVVSLLSESYNPHVRYGAAMALGIACSGTGLKEAIGLLEPMTNDPVNYVRQGALIASALVLIQQTELCCPKVAKFREIYAKVIGDKHEDIIAKFGATLAQGILDAGGRNVTISLQSRAGHTHMATVVGLFVFTHVWFWFPLSHFISLAFTPSCIIGLNSDLKMPKMQFRSNAKPSLYAYPEPLKPPKKEEKEKVTTAVLSITNKFKSRAKKSDASDEKMDVAQKEEEKEKKNEESTVEKSEKESNEKMEEEEPEFELLENPARVLPSQLKVISLPEDSRYMPMKPVNIGGIVMMTDSKSDEPEDLIEPLPASSPMGIGAEDDEEEPEPPEPFEYIDED
ncbi:PREDICTED: 26S proteasome non-ATPase regulatory subunit 1-like [Acropora digitifera]|uniref:26S proteasome non-ATPase regulatory subunit 1-like n=1 Tax=Acropora digitifera TaxID=70779 RepID=UPI00077B171E|nr:PREDICTED: 26S proteasome non-ATPase regulatory subunit 1-like [Acropora digitifera]